MTRIVLFHAKHLKTNIIHRISRKDKTVNYEHLMITFSSDILSSRYLMSRHAKNNFLKTVIVITLCQCQVCYQNFKYIRFICICSQKFFVGNIKWLLKLTFV